LPNISWKKISSENHDFSDSYFSKYVECLLEFVNLVGERNHFVSENSIHIVTTSSSLVQC